MLDISDDTLRDLVMGMVYAELIGYDQSRLTRDIFEDAWDYADEFMKKRAFIRNPERCEPEGEVLYDAGRVVNLNSIVQQAQKEIPTQDVIGLHFAALRTIYMRGMGAERDRIRRFVYNMMRDLARRAPREEQT